TLNQHTNSPLSSPINTPAANSANYEAHPTIPIHFPTHNLRASWLKTLLPSTPDCQLRSRLHYPKRPRTADAPSAPPDPRPAFPIPKSTTTPFQKTAAIHASHEYHPNIHNPTPQLVIANNPPIYAPHANYVLDSNILNP